MKKRIEQLEIVGEKAVKTVKLYHATPSADVAIIIEDEGFRGGNVWDYEDVVFFADKPLTGFGGWRQAWVEVTIPETLLQEGYYPESDWDNQQYDANCYCFPADVINQYPRRAFLDRVPGFEEV